MDKYGFLIVRAEKKMNSLAAIYNSLSQLSNGKAQKHICPLNIQINAVLFDDFLFQNGLSHSPAQKHALVKQESVRFNVF